jgi:para-aminobenzoate synthetase component 1
VSTAAAIKSDKVVLCGVHYRKIEAGFGLDSLNEVFSKRAETVILGGNKAKGDADGFSYWMCEPREILELKTDCEEPFGKLQGTIDKYKLKNIDEVPLPRAAGLTDAEAAMRPGVQNDIGGLPAGIFLGGWAGYFSYELGGCIERIAGRAVDDLKMPLVRLGFYDKVICYDHKQNHFWLIALEIDGDSQSGEEKIDELEGVLEQASQIKISKVRERIAVDIEADSVECNMTRGYYLEAVERIKRLICDGDVYQVNFSQRFCCDYTARPVELFHWQNRHNPCGYSAFLSSDEFAIVSASPEMFITVADNWISTKPIKGTRRRFEPISDENITANERNYRELAESEKEQAELNMIIDLERNDLVKVCEYGTRRVVQGRTIEVYPTVFHAVATVGGQLRRGVKFCDILKAMFPGGSITGAPKVSAMNIIDETEPTQRGVYTGSIGYVGVDGSVCLNIAIRTVIISGQKAYVQVGGGIVADSEPSAEYEETITKARALLDGIKAVGCLNTKTQKHEESKKLKVKSKNQSLKFKTETADYAD